MIIGFDVSSKNIGYGVLDIDGNYVDSGVYSPAGNGELEQLSNTEYWVGHTLARYKIKHVGIEKLIPFMVGKSTSKTIIKLAKFNSIVGVGAFRYGIYPEFFHVKSIRSILKDENNKAPKSKEEVYNRINRILGIEGDETYNDGYDISDGLAVAYYYFDKLRK